MTRVVGLLTAVTFGCSPDQGEDIVINGGEPAVSKGELISPW